MSMSVGAEEDRDERQANQRAYWLIAGLVAVALGLVGLAVTLLAGAGPWGLGLGLGVAVLLVGLAPGLGERLVLRRLGARQADPERDARALNLVQGLCEHAKLPVPRLWVVQSEAANALAVAIGRQSGQAAIVVTSGLLARLNRIELEGVLAHELAHVRASSARLGAMAVILGGLPGLALEARRRGGNPLLGLLGMVLLPLAPLLKLAAPPRREFQADQRGAYLTRYPPGLVRALTKLREDPNAAQLGNLGLNHLWIVAPGPAATSQSGGSGLERVFDTHPPLGDRIEALREL
jgi:heat shock protein HtpX